LGSGFGVHKKVRKDRRGLVLPHETHEASAALFSFSGSVGKNAERKEESVELQPLDLLLLILLLELLRETRRRARLIGEKH
jgi:hypothetical protein